MILILGMERGKLVYIREHFGVLPFIRQYHHQFAQLNSHIVQLLSCPTPVLSDRNTGVWDSSMALRRLNYE